MSKRRLIEDWLPIAALGAECEREGSAAIKPPLNRLHVWWARRPLVASRAAILGNLREANADREKFLHDLGIHGDPVVTQARIRAASLTGENLGPDLYGYPRAYQYLSESVETGTVLDPTAGGGSIPFEAARLGLSVIANDLNAVAAFLLKATVELPLKHGVPLAKRYRKLVTQFIERATPLFDRLFPAEPTTSISVDGYLWARTIRCPYCGGIIPLSPNWRVSHTGAGVRLIPDCADGERRIRFEVVERESEHSPGTVKDGDGLCPFADCQRTIDGDKEIKPQAQAGNMGHQLYCVVCREAKVVGVLKNGRPKIKVARAFRAPRQADDVETVLRDRLANEITGLCARNVIPDEEIDSLSNYDRGHRLYGIKRWADMFSSRQLLGHAIGVQVFQELAAGAETDLDKAALVYLAIALDKLLNYNSIYTRWDVKRGIRGTFDQHNYGFQWSYAEMAPAITGGGYKWATHETERALSELIGLMGHSPENPLFATAQRHADVNVTCESGDKLSVPDSSVDCVVMDPPYYDNVMYAELADFFYVWLKRTAGLLYPDLFTSHLTDKDREAVANAARFAGQKGGAKKLAGRDYQHRMAAIFDEQRRKLKPDAIMTVMFTHKAKDAWDALTAGLIGAGFEITASWPVRTESESSLHIREKSAARSTIFLVCRVREADTAATEPRYWEEVEPTVRRAVRAKVKEFQEAGIGGIDLYLACFGPALQVFTEAWPLTRGTARPQPKTRQRDLFEEFDPYAVRPEDALEAARREVKQWRMEQLATVKRQHHLDALTEWYVLAWDAFRAPRFPADEALKLARVVGLDFDQDVKKQVCEVKGDDVILWDSVTRHRNGSLRHVSEECMLDTLHWAAKVGREHNTGAARSLIEDARLIGDPTLLTALEALLNVLPPRVASAGRKKPDANLTGAANDFEALERLRKLAFSETVPAPKIPEQIPLELPDAADAQEEDA